jgi:response regulator of citrate/malate metabolism
MLNEKLTGLDVMKIVLAKNTECFVIIISGQQDPDVVADFLNGGAWKYVNKNNPKFLNIMVDFILLAIKEYEKQLMLADINSKMSDMQNLSNERRAGKQNY